MSDLGSHEIGMSIDPGQDGTERCNNGGVQVTAVLRVVLAGLALDVVTHP